MKEILSERIPIKSWVSDLEDGALHQAWHLANLPFSFSHVALMPDSHQGYGMPIGGVLATKDVVIPNAVGVDIGCGMSAIKTSLTYIDQDCLKKILGDIRTLVPVGFEHHSNSQDMKWMPKNLPVNSICEREFNSAIKQIGTLGGGNHFIEIQKGSDGFIWIMLHSGSRNLGKQVAEYYNKLAKSINSKMNIKIDPKWDLAYLPSNTEEFNSYITEMNYCIEFAFNNRLHMIDDIKKAFTNNISVTFDSIINIAHNYVRLENHFGEDVYVHRKGATSAKEGETGIIPGSQGTKSYIVKGLGNPESFMSCSHGAGRKMGRGQARRELSMEEEVNKLNSQGILHAIRSQSDLDEAPGAYKDIDVVMENQKDLVEITIELKPIAVIKG